MDYNFDEIVDRRGTNSIKHDYALNMGMPDGLIPLWVADMDFKTLPQVSEELANLVGRSVYGYTGINPDYFEAIRDWFSDGFGYGFERDWLVTTPGVVYSICTAIRAFTNVSDAILIQTPVYHPFKGSIDANCRKTITNPLIYEGGKYHIDFIDFEQKIIDNNVKMFILCSPHNPVGRVWSKDELCRMGNICLKHGVLIVSDEIHCDFVYDGNKHTVFSSLGEAYLNNSIVCTSPCKTFNIAGLQVSNSFIADKRMRERFCEEAEKTGCGQPNMMGLAACRIAYEHGRDWVAALNKYLAKNVEFVRCFLDNNVNKIKLVEPEGTYLIWLDCRALEFSDEALSDFIINKARLWVNNGTKFGIEGSGFIRVNIASPLSVIQKAFEQLRDSIM